MIRRRRAILAPLLCAIIPAVLLAACGGDSGSSSKSPTPGAQATGIHTTTASTVIASGTVDARIRSIDLSQADAVKQLVTATGGQYIASSVIYADLTADGIEDAVVPIASGGTMGDVAYVVLTADGGGVKALPLEKGTTSSGGVAVTVEGGNIIDTRPVYGPSDPNCCPSKLKKTTYHWSGSKFEEASSETVDNPDAGVKGTPAAGVTPHAPNSAPVVP
jgi:hypothetical protein